MAGGLPNQDSRSPTPDGRPVIPNYELLRCIGHGAYGEVWLARNLTGSFFAVKVVYRRAFDHDRPFKREFEGIQRFEPISRSHPSQLAIHHVGRSEDGSCFYYVMDLADAALGIRYPASGIQYPASYIPLTLKHLARAHDRLPVAECVRIGLALTTALEHLAFEELAVRLRLKISADEQRQINTLLTNNLEALGWYRQAQAV